MHCCAPSGCCGRGMAITPRIMFASTLPRPLNHLARDSQQHRNALDKTLLTVDQSATAAESFMLEQEQKSEVNFVDVFLAFNKWYCFDLGNHRRRVTKNTQPAGLWDLMQMLAPPVPGPAPLRPIHRAPPFKPGATTGRPLFPFRPCQQSDVTAFQSNCRAR